MKRLLNFKSKANNISKSKKAPVTNIIQKENAVLTIFAIAACATSITYLVRGYLNVFLSESLQYTTHSALQYTIFTLTCLTIFFPVFGLLTDRFGTNTILNFGLLQHFFFFILPAWYLVVYTNWNKSIFRIIMYRNYGSCCWCTSLSSCNSYFPT